MINNDLMKDIPDQAKYAVLQSMVSSLNCSLIGYANNLASRFATDGYAPNDWRIDEIETLLTSPDDSWNEDTLEARVSALEAPRATLRMRNYLHKELLHEIAIIYSREKMLGLKRDRPLLAGDMHESIEFMTKPRAPRHNAMLDAEAKAAGLRPGMYDRPEVKAVNARHR